MRLDFQQGGGGAVRKAACRVTGETRRLSHVLLAEPTFLDPVPCCAATRASLADGHATCTDTARAQHMALRGVLKAAGVACTVVPALAGAPDLCFARDGLVATPWGLTVLNPALPHRRRETEHLLAALADAGLRPVRRIGAGTIEGGDVCVVAPGRLAIGCSGERTTLAGAEAFAAPFRAAGWEVAICPFDPHFLHLDTIFCMVDEGTALARLDALDAGFLLTLAAWGIETVPVTPAEVDGLGCNVVSLDGRRIVMAAGHARIEAELERRGFDVLPVDVSQFAACGGGIHCLTMPVLRG